MGSKMAAVLGVTRSLEDSPGICLGHTDLLTPRPVHLEFKAYLSFPLNSGIIDRVRVTVAPIFQRPKCAGLHGEFDMMYCAV